ncbi:fibronectin type III-like domain-contianing protein [Bradyrhizobium guangzhouense]|uniref:fibronectin type III-like domain-contianing protein n=1 Tax=Bradyrhizobium guangzhouense TaxID=1325095 RepID=UPI001FDFA9F0|nr:fibronectin type III-like domain-contianing protein [Bradyrhizobium guangzhouense]
MTLDPAERRELTLALPPRAFSYFDTRAQAWRIEAGRFEISAGFSVADISQSAMLPMVDSTIAV